MCLERWPRNRGARQSLGRRRPRSANKTNLSSCILIRSHLISAYRERHRIPKVLPYTRADLHSPPCRSLAVPADEDSQGPPSLLPTLHACSNLRSFTTTRLVRANLLLLLRHPAAIITPPPHPRQSCWPTTTAHRQTPLPTPTPAHSTATNPGLRPGIAKTQPPRPSSCITNNSTTCRNPCHIAQPTPNFQSLLRLPQPPWILRRPYLNTARITHAAAPSLRLQSFCKATSRVHLLLDRLQAIATAPHTPGHTCDLVLAARH